MVVKIELAKAAVKEGDGAWVCVGPATEVCGVDGAAVEAVKVGVTTSDVGEASAVANSTPSACSVCAMTVGSNSAGKGVASSGADNLEHPLNTLARSKMHRMIIDRIYKP